MDLGSLLAAVTGAIIALAGTLLADVGRDRRQLSRADEQNRRETCVDFVLALNDAHAGLREMSESDSEGGERRAAANRALVEADLYGARERLLLTVTPSLIKMGETAFLRLVAIRTAIGDGARTRSLEYHDAYHPFAEALWQFRVAVRVDLRQTAIVPEGLDRTSWSERDSCAFCNGHGT